MAKDPLDMLRQQAQEAISRGQYQEARQIYQQALGHRSDAPEIHYGLATACFLLGDLQSAVTHFKEVVRLDPLRAGAFINLGAVYDRLGQFDEALASLRKGIQLDPNKPEGYYNLGLVYKQMNQLDMAITAYREAVRINPRMHDAHYNLGNIFLERGQVGLAIAHYKSALDIRPGWEKARNALEAAQAAHAAQETPAEKPVDPVPAPVSNLDPDRLLDPHFHGKLLGAVHDLIVKTDEEAHQLLEFLQKEMEAAIRDLSICILTPNDPSHNLDEQLHRFNAVVTRLQEIHDSMQERVSKLKLVGEQVVKI